MSNFQCAYCDYGTKTKAILMMHIKNKHPEDFEASSQEAEETAPPARSPPPAAVAKPSRPPQQQKDDGEDLFPGGPAPQAARPQFQPRSQAQQQEPPQARGPLKFNKPQFDDEEEEEPYYDEREHSQRNEPFERIQHQLESVQLADPTTTRPSLLHGVNEVTVKYSEHVPNAELYKAANSFEELPLDPNLLKGIYAMGFNRPSKIQETVLPLLLKKNPQGRYNNMIAQSQSGTGKTAAFALTMLSRVDPNVPACQAICVTNARELANQITTQIQGLGKFTGIRCFSAVGGSADDFQAQIVVGTPGVIQTLMMKRKIDPRMVKIFVLDEADVMLGSQGLGDQSLKIKKLLSDDCQLLLFSATFPEEVRQFAYKIIPQPIEISLKREELTVDAIGQYYIVCNSFEEKFRVLFDLYNLIKIGSGIIFCGTKEAANRIYNEMKRDGYSVGLLTGDLHAQARDEVMELFRQAKVKVLISTNVISRGIDISQVNLVINFDLPILPGPGAEPDYETYLHRIGRTGRFGRTGSAVNLVLNRDEIPLRKLESYFKIKIDPLPSDLEGLENALEKIQL